VYKVLVGKPEGKRPLGRPRRMWEDGIRMDLRTWGGCGLDSTGSGQRPVAGCCECGDEPSGSCATELVLLLYSFRLVCLGTLSHFSLYLLTCDPFFYHFSLFTNHSAAILEPSSHSAHLSIVTFYKERF
jgi:hypothetical protein